MRCTEQRASGGAVSNLGHQACTAESWPPTAAATLRQHHAVLADPRIPGVASAVLKAAQAAGVLTVLDADICPVLALSTAASYVSLWTFPPRTSQRYATARAPPHARHRTRAPRGVLCTFGLGT